MYIVCIKSDGIGKKFRVRLLSLLSGVASRHRRLVTVGTRNASGELTISLWDSVCVECAIQVFPTWEKKNETPPLWTRTQCLYG